MWSMEAFFFPLSTLHFRGSSNSYTTSTTTATSSYNVHYMSFPSNAARYGLLKIRKKSTDKLNGVPFPKAFQYQSKHGLTFED